MAKAWTNNELDRVGAAEELVIASVRGDGALSKPRTIWVVRVDDGIYVRSVYGPTSDWFRATRTRQEGHVRAGGVDKDVAFLDADHAVDDQVDAAYRSKYAHYAAEIVQAITSPQASSTTTLLAPR
ncbi:DUF2255 family protein [Streptomyces mirabilis]|uniref:DUF2255 family protein n=1 Tax=Streptomyces mirabilis TaxID=68239 RepID=UPI002251DFBF|nr:DUF2255 family protein [Streptomyces mirabilis]MCX5356262.1 DUF2255 family protein [Streptomyces mirabilis]